jgi:hypothetical protein
MLELSKHFCEQWRRYFNEDPPSPERIMAICNKAIWLQRCNKSLFDNEGVPYKVLSMYWDPERNIVIKVDWDTKKIVTVITPKSKEQRARS